MKMEGEIDPSTPGLGQSWRDLQWQYIHIDMNKVKERKDVCWGLLAQYRIYCPLQLFLYIDTDMMSHWPLPFSTIHSPAPDIFTILHFVPKRIATMYTLYGNSLTKEPLRWAGGSWGQKIYISSAQLLYSFGTSAASWVILSACYMWARHA